MLTSSRRELKMACLISEVANLASDLTTIFEYIDTIELDDVEIRELAYWHGYYSCASHNNQGFESSEVFKDSVKEILERINDASN